MSKENKEKNNKSTEERLVINSSFEEAIRVLLQQDDSLELVKEEKRDKQTEKK